MVFIRSTNELICSEIVSEIEQLKKKLKLHFIRPNDSAMGICEKIKKIKICALHIWKSELQVKSFVLVSLTYV